MLGRFVVVVAWASGRRGREDSARRCGCDFLRWGSPRSLDEERETRSETASYRRCGSGVSRGGSRPSRRGRISRKMVGWSRQMQVLWLVSSLILAVSRGDGEKRRVSRATAPGQGFLAAVVCGLLRCLRCLLCLRSVVNVSGHRALQGVGCPVASAPKTALALRRWKNHVAPQRGRIRIRVRVQVER